MIIKRTTWITEETQNGQENTLKIIKGPAIISERYVQEAHLIARELIEPFNIEKNKLSREQEETLINEMSTIDQTEIEPPHSQGYNDIEKESIAKIIADISLVFWIKNRDELSKIQISPKIDWKTASQYKDTQGEWQRNMGNGWTGFIPGGAIVSK